MADAAKRRSTYAEYLAFEEASAERHEFVAGEILAMAGGTIEHGRIMSRLTVLLSAALGGRPCVVLPSDVRVRIRAADRATYPDLHVVCGRVERDADDQNAVTNPVVVIEVLSDSTAAGDRGDGSPTTAGSPASRVRARVSAGAPGDVYHRDGRRWVLDEHRRAEAVRLDALDVTIPVDDICVDALGPIVA
ncbi:MAG: Uma2 family endonuclease [Polyangiaceae bacterium]